MSKTIYKVYSIRVTKNRGFYPIDNKGVKAEYEYPHTLKNLPKIYIFTKNKEAYYIGYTTQPLSSRFRSGINAALEPQKSYKGYQWINKSNILSLHVYCFILTVKANLKKSKMFENLESEIVYFYKKKFDKWPKYQSEIHFYERIGSTKNIKKIAGKIFEKIF